MNQMSGRLLFFDKDTTLEQLVKTKSFIQFCKDAKLTGRDVKLIRACCIYAKGQAPGLPGHNLMMLISKFVDAMGWQENVRIEASDVLDKHDNVLWPPTFDGGPSTRNVNYVEHK